HDRAVNRLAFSPEGYQLVSGSEDGRVIIWDGRPLLEEAPWVISAYAHPDCIFSVSYRSDGDCIATAKLDGSVTLSDPRNGEQLRNLVGHTRLVWDVRFSPDRVHVASASYDGTAKIWDVNTGKVVHSLQHPAQVNSVAYRPDGLQLVTGSSDA